MYSRTRNEGFIMVLAPIMLMIFLWNPTHFIKSISWRKSLSSAAVGISKIRKLETVKAVTVDNPSFKTKSEFRLNTNLETNMVISSEIHQRSLLSEVWNSATLFLYYLEVVYHSYSKIKYPSSNILEKCLFFQNT